MASRLLRILIYSTMVINFGLVASSEARGRVEFGLEGGALHWRPGSPTSYDFLFINQQMSRRQNEYFGLVLAGFPNRHIGFELLLQGGRWDYDLDLMYHDTTGWNDTYDTVSSIDCNEFALLLGNLVLQPFQKRFTPYGVVGGGLHASALNFNLALDWGAGLKVRLFKPVLLRFDFRTVVLRLKNDFPGFSSTTFEWYTIPYKGIVRHQQISAGICYYVDRE